MPVLLISVALFASNFNYLIVSWFQSERHPVLFAPEFFLGSIFLIGAFVITRGRTDSSQASKSRLLSMPLFFLLAAVVWMSLSLLVTETLDPRFLITLSSLVLYCVAARRRVVWCLPNIVDKRGRLLIGLCVLWLIALSVFYYSGSVYYERF